MGTSAVDLPDPLQQAAAPETAQSADDLLAQLAGDEIDRLLAEADGDARKPRKPAAAPAPDAVSDPEPRPDPEPEPAVAEAVEAPSPVADSNVREEAASAAVAEPAASPPEPVAVEDPTPVEPDSAADAVSAELAEDETLSAAMSAGEMPASEVAVSLPGVLDEVLTTAAEPEGSPSLLLRPLYWLNRPFEDLSDQTRSILGKVAILTLLNAAAILAYVLFLRK